MSVDRISVNVKRVMCPPGDTLGYGYGTTTSGLRLTFAGDHRPMRALAEAVQASRGQPVVAVIWPYQVLAFEEDKE